MPIQGQTAIAVAPFNDNVGLEATPGRSPLVLLVIAFLTLDGIALDPLLQTPQLPHNGLPSVSRHDPAVDVAHDDDGRHPRCTQESEQGRTLGVMEGKVVKPGIQQHRARYSPPVVRRSRGVVDAGSSDRGIRIRKNLVRRGVIRDANHSITPVLSLPSGQRVPEPMAHPGDGVHALTIGRIDEEEQGEGGIPDDERPPRRRCYGRVRDVVTPTGGIFVLHPVVVEVVSVEIFAIPAIRTRTTRRAVVRQTVWIEWEGLGQEPQYPRLSDHGDA